MQTFLFAALAAFALAEDLDTDLVYETDYAEDIFYEDTNETEALLLEDYKNVIRAAWAETKEILREKIESAHVVFVEETITLEETSVAQISTTEELTNYLTDM